MGPELIIIVAAVVVGLYMAWSIGANDVANSMGTSVASGALTMKQAIILAGVCNFIGAVFVGTHVTNTVRKGVLDISNFAHDPTTLVYGMLAVLLGASIWVTLATYKKLPVSTTHSIIGAVIGFGIVEIGFYGIRWHIVGAIVLSWLISPLGGALISFTVFKIIRKTIFNATCPVAAVKKIGPLFIGLVFTILCLAIIFKGLKHLHLDLPLPKALLISLGVGLMFGLLGFLFLRNHPVRKGEEYEQVEGLANPLQILSAAYEAFAHGANDVANAIGPVAAIYAILQTHQVDMQVSVPTWILAIGGLGIVAGISTWGYRVMETVGKKITEITPTRGFSAEFGTATTVLIFSKLGMPVSTTHACIGNVIGVGCARGLAALNFAVVGRIILMWIVSLPAAAVLTIVFFKLLVFILG
ncbi:MAG: inorganic phosphate transporter [Gemmatimonadota bacterium]|nr:MAG: inorganic phosphate transporter [Gemmatimonadota bacterium]